MALSAQRCPDTNDPIYFHISEFDGNTSLLLGLTLNKSKDWSIINRCIAQLVPYSLLTLISSRTYAVARAQ